MHVILRTDGFILFGKCVYSSENTISFSANALVLQALKQSYLVKHIDKRDCAVCVQPTPPEGGEALLRVD